MYQTIPEYINGVPNISGSEEPVEKAMQSGLKKELFKRESRIDFGKIKSAAAIGLHMHQPLIPAGGGDLRTAAIISNLKNMMDNQGTGDNHNAPVFHWCYKRMGEYIPQLVQEGKEPRVMLDYSGTLLHGLRAMGLDDVFGEASRSGVGLLPIAVDLRIAAGDDAELEPAENADQFLDAEIPGGRSLRELDEDQVRLLREDASMELGQGETVGDRRARRSEGFGRLGRRGEAELEFGREPLLGPAP